ncbi:transposase [Saccharothrix sp. 6-C]|uniref:transposase n=1 Tax=Saccharothrix sp. 6-C TaxID=2781735 RepID=UPI0019177F7D|nr:transposase [Saccharothrix sp. 6-C]
MPAGGSVAGAPCCRLSASHRSTERTARHPTDVTDAQWVKLDPLLPDPSCLSGRGGRWEGHCRRLLDALRDRVRLAEGREAAPSAAIVDSQPVRAAETVGRATRGWDGGKKVAGRKRRIVVDTLGLLLAVLVTPASTQDRVAARSLLRRMRDTAGGRVRLVWADGA